MHSASNIRYKLEDSNKIQTHKKTLCLLLHDVGVAHYPRKVKGPVVFKSFEMIQRNASIISNGFKGPTYVYSAGQACFKWSPLLLKDDYCLRLDPWFEGMQFF